MCSRAQPPLNSSNRDLGAIICLTDRKWKQTKSISGQNRIARREMIEADPSIADPDHTWWHVVGDVSFCPELSALVVNLDPITVGQLSRFSVDPGYPKLRCRVVFGQRWQGSSLIVECMKVRQCSSEAQRQRILGTVVVGLMHRERW